jgi:phenylpyruvate tautomerase PptA (4-oxalocrotonate tautomerase family)
MEGQASVGAEVQRRVADYLERMAGARPERVDVVVDEIGRPA